MLPRLKKARVMEWKHEDGDVNTKRTSLQITKAYHFRGSSSTQAGKLPVITVMGSDQNRKRGNVKNLT